MLKRLALTSPVGRGRAEGAGDGLLRLWKTLMACWDELAFFSTVPHLALRAFALRAALSRLGEG